MEIFRFWFNRRRNWVDVYLHEVTPETFMRRGGGRWGYYVDASERGRVGKFGELHLVRGRVREDVVAHEVFHLFADWIRFRKVELNKDNEYHEKTEEKLALTFDEFIRSFWREYKKLPQLARKKSRR